MSIPFTRSQRGGVGPFRAGLVALVVIAVLGYFGFTRANPFASPYELRAAFASSSNLKPGSPVRIAGVDVGKVKSVEPVGGKRGARVEMELQDRALPIHNDAELKIRPRIFLEGNFFVDLHPGSPSAPQLPDGSTIPMTQTAAPVQFGDLLSTLQSDTRRDLQTFLQEYSSALRDGGARGFNQSLPYWKPAYRDSALANEATLGVAPDRDLHRVLSGQQRTFAALVADEDGLKGLVTNLNVTAGALASQDSALSASIPALRDTLSVARPALRSVDTALPSLRAFAREALPGVRSSTPALNASLPFLRQLRLLMSKRELRGTAAELRRRLPSLVALNRNNTSLLTENRQLAACTNKVLLPYIASPIPDAKGEPPENNDQLVRWQIQRTFPGLAGESRLSDGSAQQWFHTSGVPNPTNIQPAPPPDPGQPPPHRPDVPCETQQAPDLHAPSAPLTAFGSTSASALHTHFNTAALEQASRLMSSHMRKLRTAK